MVTSARPFRSTARPPTSPRRVSSFECAGSPPAPPSPGQHKRIGMQLNVRMYVYMYVCMYCMYAYKVEDELINIEITDD